MKNRFQIRDCGRIFDSLYYQSFAYFENPETACQLLNESDLNGKHVNGVSMGQDKNGNRIFVSDGLAENIVIQNKK